MTESRKGDWFRLASGTNFWPMDPRIEDIKLPDIAHALSKICRWGGHSKVFFTVAQHCLLVSGIGTSLVNRQWGLMHDAAEAYIGDMIRPIKLHIAEYRGMEGRILRLIAEKFNLPWPIPDAIKRADNRVMATEARDLMAGPDIWPLIDAEPHSDKPIDVMTSAEAEAAYLTAFHWLFKY